MDEMALKLRTNFMKNIVSKLITKSFYKKYGYKIDIQLDDLDVSIINGETKINTNVTVKLDGETFKEIVKTMI